MITARVDAARMVARLTARAGRLAAAHAEARLRHRRGDVRRWRLARLLWPLFGSDAHGEP
jgi:hypothetical protein